MSDNEIFTIKARRCQRCGGILLSEYGLKYGMGHVCKRKSDEEAAAAVIDENQLTLMELESERSEVTQEGGESE